MTTKTIILFFIVSFCTSISIAEDGMSASDVIVTFKKYELLNKEYVASVGTASSTDLRQQAEEYAEGPFDQALQSAVQINCRNEDKELLHALFQVTLSTSNSASETPAWTLGRIFVCKPDFFEKEFKALTPSNQEALYEILSFAFENVAYNSKNDSNIDKLRNRLFSMAPNKDK
ncbi:hypothetical protein JWJ90_21825 [Desulfobulbus rhabdoformis]|uniref:hypothetical protein n=1 Tax=Desulfobulbus rhabdoformis TaxID=34032 RepID=UPI00196627CE|nr:hypothetical protein [Desulfobulbus rhabdoformis]MBM9616905.1 hypothetical protein [Desulfobulbus rhabdoformis]